jgi:NADPH-dependent curcumin reductase CurA
VAEHNRKVVLAARPDGLPATTDFRVEEESLEPLSDGHVRVDVEHLSIDAFIRTTLEQVSFHPSISLGGTVMAFGAGRVRESASEGFAPGDAVVGPVGAQSVATVSARFLQKVDAERVPLASPPALPPTWVCGTWAS